MSSLKSFYANSHPGEYLEINEDAIIVEPRLSLFGVIDGYGGSGIGDETADLVKKTIVDNYGILAKDQDATLPLYFNPDYNLETNALINTLQLAHAKVTENNANKKSCNRGGSSFLGGIAKTNVIQLVGTGNCMGLKISEKNVSVIFSPDSSGEMKIFGEPKIGVPHSGIGLFQELNFNVREVNVRKGDLVVLMSSGSYAPFNLVDLGVILLEYAKKGPEIIKRNLSTLAASRGSQGNQSIVCLEF